MSPKKLLRMNLSEKFCVFCTEWAMTGSEPEGRKSGKPPQTAERFFIARYLAKCVSGTSGRFMKQAAGYVLKA